MVYRDTYVEWVWDKHDRDMNVGVGRGVGVGVFIRSQNIQ